MNHACESSVCWNGLWLRRWFFLSGDRETHNHSSNRKSQEPVWLYSVPDYSMNPDVNRCCLVLSKPIELCSLAGPVGFTPLTANDPAVLYEA